MHNPAKETKGVAPVQKICHSKLILILILIIEDTFALENGSQSKLGILSWAPAAFCIAFIRVSDSQKIM